MGLRWSESGLVRVCSKQVHNIEFFLVFQSFNEIVYISKHTLFSKCGSLKCAHLIKRVYTFKRVYTSKLDILYDIGGVAKNLPLAIMLLWSRNFLFNCLISSSAM